MPASEISPKKSGIHYGWVIVFAGFMVMCFVVCIVSNCVSLFVKPVSEALGITRQAFSLNTTFYSVSGMVVSLFLGGIIKRFNVKKVMMFCSVLLPVVYAGFSVAKSIYLYYIISFVLGLLGLSMTMIPISTLMTRWFTEKRGLALGLAFTGSGFGGIFLTPFISNLIVSQGYQRTYFILAVLMFAAVVPCTFFLIKNRPEDMGLEPYGGYPKEHSSGNVTVGLTGAEVRKIPLFYVWLAIAVMVTAGCSSLMQQLVPYVSDLGFDLAFTASIGAMLMGCLAAGKIALGQIFDSIGAKRGALLSLSMLLCTYILLLFAASKPFLYAAVIMSSIGISFATVAYPVVTQSLFGTKDYANIYSIVTLASNLGMAFGSPVTASIYDKTGSYYTAWAAYAVLVAICIVLFLLLFKNKAKFAPEAAAPIAGA